MEASPWVETASIIGTALGAAVLGVVGGRKTKKKDEPEGDAQLVMGALLGPQQFQSLTTAVVNIHGALLELNDLLKADAQRRHDEAVIRQALKDRGIVE